MSSSVASLDGKCALVTGAATGIGKAIATALAAAGARVVVNHNHTPESAEKVAVAINAAGGTAMALAADVSSRAEYQAMVQRLLAAFGRWDILVNNAAVAITKSCFSAFVSVPGAAAGTILMCRHGVPARP